MNVSNVNVFNYYYKQQENLNELFFHDHTKLFPNLEKLTYILGVFDLKSLSIEIINLIYLDKIY